MKNFSKSSEQFIHRAVSAYLSERPLFYSLIRPQEAYYFNTFQKYINSPVLDYGAGDGFFANVAFKQQLDIGLDISSSRIKASLGKANPYQNLIIYDGSTIPLKNHVITTVVSNCVFEHLPNIKAKLTELKRIIKPGGYCVTSVMTDLWEEYLLGKIIAGKTYLKYFRTKQIHHNLLSANEWEALFTQVGFQTILVRGYLGKKTSRYSEISHYLATPSLLSYHLTGRWIMQKSWHKPFFLTEMITKVVISDVNTPVDESAALFFVLKHSD